MDKEKLLEQWRGKDKIKTIRKRQLNNKKWRLDYYEGRKRAHVDFDDLKTCDEFLIEFGGKNDDTVSAPPIYLDLRTFDVEEMLNSSHILKRISIQGVIASEKEDSIISVPNGCGNPYFTGKISRKDGDDVITKNVRFMRDTSSIYRQFETSEESKRFIKWITNHDQLKNFKWTVHEMVTYSKDTEQFCHWVRRKAGDGTQTMELQLHYVDKIHYQDCITADLMAAAGDLIWKECHLIEVPKSTPRRNMICVDAYGAGLIDETGRKNKCAPAT